MLNNALISATAIYIAQDLQCCSKIFPLSPVCIQIVTIMLLTRYNVTVAHQAGSLSTMTDRSQFGQIKWKREPHITSDLGNHIYSTWLMHIQWKKKSKAVWVKHHECHSGSTHIASGAVWIIAFDQKYAVTNHIQKGLSSRSRIIHNGLKVLQHHFRNFFNVFQSRLNTSLRAAPLLMQRCYADKWPLQAAKFSMQTKRMCKQGIQNNICGCCLRRFGSLSCMTKKNFCTEIPSISVLRQLAQYRIQLSFTEVGCTCTSNEQSKAPPEYVFEQ